MMDSSFASGASPIKGLERLSEDLRQERQKATIALQDRARLRVEVESLKGTVQQQLQDLKECKQFLEASDQQREQLHAELTNLLQEKQDTTLELQHLREKLASSDVEIGSGMREREKCFEEVKAVRVQYNALQSSYSVVEAKLNVKEQQLSEYATEIEHLRHLLNQSEDKEARSAQLLSERQREIDELGNRVQQADVLRESYHQHLLASEEIKKELEKSMSNSLYISQQLRESSYKLSEQHAYCQELELKLQRLGIERDSLVADKHELECAVEELSARVNAEAEMATTEQQRAESSARAKEYLEKQVAELRQAHTGLLEANHKLESLLNDANGEVSALNNELANAREREAEKDVALENAQQAQSLSSEVEFLRAQLSEVRKQLIKRGIEEDASVLTPKTLIERENHSRQVYEGIIVELRGDLDRANSKYQEMARKWEESRSLIVKVQQLEEEVQMYRDTARAAAVESQSVAMTASEAVERNVRNAHDKHLLLNELKQLEATLQLNAKEIQRCKEDLNVERQKHKSTYLEKLAAERKVSELLVGKSRLETELDSIRQSSGSTQLELERTRRQLMEQSVVLEEARRKVGQIDTYKNEVEAIRSAQHATKVDSARKEQELHGELSLLKQSKQLLQQEVESLRQSLELQKRASENHSTENSRLKADIVELKHEKDRQRKEFAQLENSRADAQLQNLRKELEQTMTEWQNAEKEKSAKDENMWKVQKELEREREKASLLKTQIGLLDERLRVANQELSVYRSLDVYHTSVNSELLLLRTANQTQSPSPSSKFRSLSVERSRGEDLINRLTSLESTFVPPQKQVVPEGKFSVSQMNYSPSLQQHSHFPTTDTSPESDLGGQIGNRQQARTVPSSSTSYHDNQSYLNTSNRGESIIRDSRMGLQPTEHSSVAPRETNYYQQTPTSSARYQEENPSVATLEYQFGNSGSNGTVFHHNSRQTNSSNNQNQMSYDIRYDRMIQPVEHRSQYGHNYQPLHHQAVSSTSRYPYEQHRQQKDSELTQSSNSVPLDHNTFAEFDGVDGFNENTINDNFSSIGSLRHAVDDRQLDRAPSDATGHIRTHGSLTNHSLPFQRIGQSATSDNGPRRSSVVDSSKTTNANEGYQQNENLVGRRESTSAPPRRNSMLTMRDSHELRSQLHSSNSRKSTALNPNFETETEHMSSNHPYVDGVEHQKSADVGSGNRQERDFLRQQRIREQLLITRNALPVTSNGYSSQDARSDAHRQSHANPYSAIANNIPQQNHDTASLGRDSLSKSQNDKNKQNNIKPFKADFDKARRLLAKSGFN